MAKTQKTPSGKKPSKPDDKDQDEDRDEDEDEGEEDDSGEDAEEQNRRINAIVTSRVKREMKAVNQQLSAMMAKLETMGTPAKKDEEDGDDDGEPSNKKQAEVDPKLAKKMNKLERELADEKEARKKAEVAQQDEAAKAKRQEMVTTFDAVLTEHGITDPKLRRAALMTLEADGVMVRDEESGKIKFKGVDKYGIENLYDPKVGLKQWILNEGKSFVPAVDAGGSGAAGSRIGVGNTNLTKGEFNKLSAQQKASIELERASSGLPPLGE